MKSLQCLRVWNDWIFFSLGHCQSVAHILLNCLFFPAADRREMTRKEGKLLEAARAGDISTLFNMVWECLCCSLLPRTHRCGRFNIAPWADSASPMLVLCLLFLLAQRKRSSGYSLQRLFGEYSIALCSLQGAEAMHHKAAQVWSQSMYSKQHRYITYHLKNTSFTSASFIFSVAALMVLISIFQQTVL